MGKTIGKDQRDTAYGLQEMLWHLLEHHNTLQLIAVAKLAMWGDKLTKVQEIFKVHMVLRMLI